MPQTKDIEQKNINSLLEKAFKLDDQGKAEEAFTTF